jgi:RNA polymerase sigma-70 factor, ECF subfamily
MDGKEKELIFREWVNQYYEYGFRIAFRIIGEEEDCKDILQDAYLKVWLKFDTYDNRSKFSTWLFTIITNLCLDKLRRKKTVARKNESTVYESMSESDNPEILMNNKELRNCIKKLSENLSPKQKIIFVLRDLEEMEMSEVCNITNMPANQVKANLYHARKAIKRNLVYFKFLEEKI